MSNPTNIFDFAAEDLATFLAKVVSDGTYADVFETLKTDAAGEEAPATAIPVAQGQLLGNGVDDFVLAAYPLLRIVALGGGGGGSRLITTPAPVLGGVPGAYTYTIAADELIGFLDTGGPPFNTLTITLPPIASIPAGGLIGIELPAGTFTYTIRLLPDPADSSIDPITGFTNGPGVPLVIAPGLPINARIIMEGVKAPQSTWRPRFDEGSYSGGGGGVNFTPIQIGGPIIYAAAAGDLVGYDPTGGLVRVDLPALPAAGDRIQIKNVTVGAIAANLDIVCLGPELVEHPATHVQGGAANAANAIGIALDYIYHPFMGAWLLQ